MINDPHPFTSLGIVKMSTSTVHYGKEKLMLLSTEKHSFCMKRKYFQSNREYLKKNNNNRLNNSRDSRESQYRKDFNVL